MKFKPIVSLIMLCLISVNIFAFSNFINEQKSHHHEFCSLLAHDHDHRHHGVQHSHGHVHKINLVDVYSVDVQPLLMQSFKDDKPTNLKQWHIASHLAQLFRPPIS